jgi:prepilin-type N-terminal cleavage/methylation domain-containing protein
MEGLGRQLRRARAGMTLVELLIALALMVAVAGLALPNMFAILARSTAEEGRRQALGALAGARAEAIGAGEPVRVIAEPYAGGWRLRAQSLAPERNGRGAPEELEEGWTPETMAALPSGWIALAAQSAGASVAAAELIEAVEPVEVVTFLPDGGAMAPAERARFAAGERRFSLKVDRWSGRATLQTEPAGGSEDADEAEEESRRDDDESDEWGDGAEGPQW